MELLGLPYVIWIILLLYFVGMLLLGWWSKRGIKSQEGYLLGNRRFGVFMMIMHSFGAGTHPGAPAGVISKTVSSGASGIWVSWMFIFGTPFYWLIAPIIRRMRYLTMADFYQQRFSRAASFLYIVIAMTGMIVFLASVLLATTRTVQGMMGKAEIQNKQIRSEDSQTNASVSPESSSKPDTQTNPAPISKGVSARESTYWFYGILLVITVVFIIYSYWGGIIAAVRTDMVQGLMIIALSFLAIPAALNLQEIGGFGGMLGTLSERSGDTANYLSLIDAKVFNLWTIILLSINAPISMLAYPYLISICGAGRTEWEGRMGFTYGNILKRICTIGWCLLGMCWLAYLLKTQSTIHPDAAFGDSIRTLLSPFLQGIMLACVMAAAMSSGDAVQITLGGLFSQNIYKVYLNQKADESQLLKITRRTGLLVAFLALIVAILMRSSIVKTILDYFNILGLIGISTAMGILWRRMNATGVFCSALLAVLTFVLTRYVLDSPREIVTGLSIVVGVLGGILGSYVGRPPDPKVIEKFFKRIYVPIGQEEKLELPLDKAVPPRKRWLTTGGLFIVKPTRQSWLGFLIALAICLASVLAMYLMLNL